MGAAGTQAACYGLHTARQVVLLPLPARPRSVSRARRELLPSPLPSLPQSLPTCFFSEFMEETKEFAQWSGPSEDVRWRWPPGPRKVTGCVCLLGATILTCELSLKLSEAPGLTERVAVP